MSSLADNVLIGKEHAQMLLDSILKGPFEYQVVEFPTNKALGIPAETRMQTFKDLSPEEKIIKECDIRVANIILQGLPNDIYTFLNHKKTTHEIWCRVKELIEGTQLTKQEKQSKLADEFDRFTSEKGETIHSYYIRFAKLINDINIIRLDMTPLQLNTKFFNHLQLNLSRFVTDFKQAKNLHKVSFDQLYAYLKQNEPDANEVHAIKARFPYPLALIANTYNLPPSYSSYKSQYNPPILVAAHQPYILQPSYEPSALQAQSYGNAGRGKGKGNTEVVRIVRDLKVIPPKVIKRYNFKGEGHYAKQCTTKKRVKDFKWFKEKMLLAQQQEAGIKINVEQHDFLANEKVDDYDSEVDDAPIINAIFMAKLSPAGSINKDEVGPSYDSDMLYEVPNYDTYHANDMFNPFVQELPASEQLDYVNDMYMDSLSDSNVISDNPYSDNNENKVVQEMTSLAQIDVAILSLIENMQHKVTRCNTVIL
ncbi:hypothetical protein Tco_0241279 [Tanacetum coccineum]